MLMLIPELRKALNLLLSRYAPGNVTENFTVGIFLVSISRFSFSPPLCPMPGTCSGISPFSTNVLLVYLIIQRAFRGRKRFHNLRQRKQHEGKRKSFNLSLVCFLPSLFLVVNRRICRKRKFSGFDREISSDLCTKGERNRKLSRCERETVDRLVLQSILCQIHCQPLPCCYERIDSSCHLMSIESATIQASNS